MATDYLTPTPPAPDPFDVARAYNGAEETYWRRATDGGADTAFARARRAAKPTEVEWSAPAVTR